MSCLIALVRTSGTLLNKSGVNDHTYFIHDLRGKDFSLSPLSVMLILGLVYKAFITLRCVSSITQSFENFYSGWMLYFIKLFLYIYWDDHMIFIFNSISVEIYHIYWLLYVELPLHLGDKSHFLMVYNSFNVLLSLAL